MPSVPAFKDMDLSSTTGSGRDPPARKSYRENMHAAVTAEGALSVLSNQSSMTSVASSKRLELLQSERKRGGAQVMGSAMVAPQLNHMAGQPSPPHSVPSHDGSMTSPDRSSKSLPARPRLASQADREKPAYSVDMLEYLCCSIERLVEDTSTLAGLPIVPILANTIGNGSTAAPPPDPARPRDVPIGGAQTEREANTQATGPVLWSMSSYQPRKEKTERSGRTSGRSGAPAGELLALQHFGSYGGPNLWPFLDTQMSFSDGVGSQGLMRSSGGSGGLDKSWPTNIQLRSGLQEGGTQVNKERVRAMMTRSLHKNTAKNPANNGQRLNSGHLSFRTSGRCRSLFRMHDPNSKIIRAIDVLSVIALSNDVLVTPYVLAWSVPASLGVFTFALVGAIYWFMAMVMKLFTGFYKDGELCMNQVESLKRYAKSWLLIDLTLISFDWVVLFLPPEAGGTDRNIRLAKLFRIAKIFRLARVWELVETILAKHAPEGTRSKLVVHLIQVGIMVTIFSHIMSCAWYSVGQYGHGDTGAQWLALFLTKERDDLWNRLDRQWTGTDAYNYATCFHWTLAQLTLGSIDIYPVNSMERTLNIALLLAGIIFNATIVSLISSQAVEFIANRRDQMMKINTLKRFLEQHKVDTKLAVRVQRQVLDRIRSSETLIFEDDVTALQMLSANLKQQLLFETRLPPMLGHPLFRIWWEADDIALRTLCDTAVKFEVYKAQDCVFVPGLEAEGMLMISEGYLHYFQDRESSKEAEPTNIQVHKGARVSEAALWSKWKHVGKLECARSCNILFVEAHGLITLLGTLPLLGHITRQYGRAFHLRVTLARPPYSGWPNDLEVPHTDPSDLLEQDIGLELLKRERRHNGILKSMSEEDYTELVREVESEKCSIQAGLDGVLERIVAIVAVKVERPDGRVLAQLGKFDKGKKSTSVSCALPGTKRPRGELPVQTYERLMKQDLSFLNNGLKVNGSETQVEVKESASYGMLTKYLRTVQNATLVPNFEVPHHLIEITANEQGREGGPMSPTSTKKTHSPQKRSITGWSRRQTAASQESMEGMEDLADEPVLLHEHGGKVYLFSWLSQPTFEYLRADSGKPLLETWVGSIDVSDAFEARAVQVADQAAAEAEAQLMWRGGSDGPSPVNRSQSDLATSALDSVTTSKGPQARSPASSAGDAMVRDVSDQDLLQSAFTGSATLNAAGLPIRPREAPDMSHTRTESTTEVPSSGTIGSVTAPRARMHIC
mmetsp:Transcript_52496/g.122841  ORF Transcript_52496/g.122841 Transcript_52496/m.122841 type:complete len:1239 (-) Transcript_52496:33-3749(-)